MNRAFLVLIGPCVAALAAGSVLAISWVQNHRAGALAPSQALAVAVGCYLVVIVCIGAMIWSCRHERNKGQARYEEVQEDEVVLDEPE